ncbi:STAS domain-containing protein [Embleya sp. NPDC020630]|uniref:STAS domain-containing protein n=1 Tax=Embleya sp. NPDC020630 TaxID=3363979 RepID=UPI0037AA0827
MTVRNRRTGRADAPLAIVEIPLPRRAFANWLAQIRLRAGQPSLMELCVRMRKFGVHVPKSTLGDGLTGKRLLALDRARALVRACGGDTALQAECQNRWTLAREGRLPTTPTETSITAADVRRTPAIDMPLGIVHEREGVRCELTPHDPWQIVRLHGEWDVHATRRLRPGFDRVLTDEQRPQIIVDLSAVTFMDTAVLSTLLYALKILRQRGAILRVVSGTSDLSLARVGRVMILTCVTPYLPVYPTLEAALSPLSNLETLHPVPNIPDPIDSTMPAATITGPRKPDLHSGTWRQDPPA